MITPVISAMEVINGALAVAGSSLSFVNTKGNNKPTTLPISTVNTIVIETTTITSGARKLATKATPTAIVTPRNKETMISLPINLYQSDILTSPIAKERIIKVAV